MPMSLVNLSRRHLALLAAAAALSVPGHAAA